MVVWVVHVTTAAGATPATTREEYNFTWCSIVPVLVVHRIVPKAKVALRRRHQIAKIVRLFDDKHGHPDSR